MPYRCLRCFCIGIAPSLVQTPSVGAAALGEAARSAVAEWRETTGSHRYLSRRV